MSNEIDEFTESNEAYAARRDPALGNRPEQVSRNVIIIACMDYRLNPLATFGYQVGEAYVVRNAGGRAAEGLRSVVVSQQFLDTNRIIVCHHTRCGMMGQTDAELLRRVTNRSNPELPPPPKPTVSDEEIAKAVNETEWLWFQAQNAAITEDVLLLRDHPLVRKETRIDGYVVDVISGNLVTKVTADGKLISLQPPRPVAGAGGTQA